MVGQSRRTSTHSVLRSVTTAVTCCSSRFAFNSGAVSCLSCFLFPSVFLPLFFLLQINTNVHTYRHANHPSLSRSRTQPQLVMRFQCRCRFLLFLRLTRARGFTRSLLPTILSGSRSWGKAQEQRCEYISCPSGSDGLRLSSSVSWVLSLLHLLCGFLHYFPHSKTTWHPLEQVKVKQ